MNTRNEKIEGELRNYGLRFTVITDDQYGQHRLGAVALPKLMINPSRDWSTYYPTYEPQFGNGWDTYGCTVWGTENAVEMMLKCIEGKEYNFSERYIYNIVGITPPGADPHAVAEAIRNYGLIDQEVMPFTKTYEEFCKPRPMTAAFLKEGIRFNYKVGHEWLWTDSISKAERLTRIREALMCSPVAVSVTAWFKQGDVYVDNGQVNTHWCVIGREVANGWEVFDSYDQSVKVISFDHNIMMAKRYGIDVKEATPSWFQYLWRLVSSLFTDAKALKVTDKTMPAALPPEPPAVVEVRPETRVEPKPTTVEEVKQLITSVAVECGVDPELAVNVAFAESRLNPKAKGKPNNDKYKSYDRGLYQLNSFWYEHVPDDVAYDVRGATEVFCRAVRSGRLVDWRYSMKQGDGSGWGQRTPRLTVLKYMAEDLYNKFA